MGKQRIFPLFAGEPPQPEPDDSTMSEPQLPAPALEPARWTPSPQPSWWNEAPARARPPRLH
jgi:hypothetical protein